MILGEGRRKAGMDRYRQLQTPLQKSTHKSGNDMRRRRKKKWYVISHLVAIFKILLLNWHL
jgi:hypothetical protein